MLRAHSMELLIYGAKEFAVTVSSFVRDCGYRVAGMVDDYNVGDGILGSLDTVARSHPPSENGFAMAIGYSNIPARWRAWERVRALGYCAPALIHPRAYVADSARIGAGVMIMAGSIVDTNAEVGDLAVVWPGACVNHDVLVGQNSFISPNATVCGFARIGPHSFIGAGAVIVDHGNVPEASFVKMLTRYTRDSS